MRTLKKLAVVSVLGQKVERTYIGFTVFNNAYSTEDFTPLKLDEYFEGLMAGAVSSTGRTVQSTTWDRASLAKANEDMREVDVSKISDGIALVCRNAGADAVLLLSASTSSYGSSSIRFTGLSVWAGINRPALLDTHGRLSLISCSGQQLLANRILGEGQGSDGKLFQTSVPSPARAQLQKGDSWTSEEKARIAASVKETNTKILPGSTLKLLGEK
ncbi:hypothetical protein [Ideonella paludis]|uniref:hypothetical protein n=1 Tax=Ideonella paludis TaxID=1233411 RepID=UPI00362E6E8F